FMSPRLVRPTLEILEARVVPSWTIPWATLSPVPWAPSVTLNSAGDAHGTNSIVPNYAFIYGYEIDWHQFKAPISGTYRVAVQTPFSQLDSIVAVYKNVGFQLQLVGWNNDISANDTDSSVGVNLTIGQTYYVGITNYGDPPAPGGKYNWQIDGPRWDDDFEN